MPKSDAIKHGLESGPGYTTIEISCDDLEDIRDLVLRSFQRRISSSSDSTLVSRLSGFDPENYHTYVSDSEHKSLWGKESRMLCEEEIKRFKSLLFYQQLITVNGNIEITDEERAGKANIYWRIVRPNKADDVGPVHADYMFWELSGAKIPEGKKRLKVWIPLYCEPCISGLRLIPFSHKQNYEYYGEIRDGKLKPVLKVSQRYIDEKLEIFHSTPGQALVFHDRLLHGGFHKGNKTRFSIELTLLVNKH